MSSIGSLLQNTNMTVLQSQSPAHAMTATGSVYNATKVAAIEGESQAFYIDDLGRLHVIDKSVADLDKNGGAKGAATLRVALCDEDRALIDGLESIDYATQATLEAVRVLLASMASEDFATEVTLAALNSKDFATQTTLAALEGKDFATQTTLAAINSKDFATSAKQDTIIGHVDGVETKLDSVITQTAAPINGSQTTGTVSTVATLTAPANAIGFILQAADTNAANLRYRIGAVATTTVGQQLQAGRDTGYVPCGASISIVSESGTNEYQIQWIVR